MGDNSILGAAGIAAGTGLDFGAALDGMPGAKQDTSGLAFGGVSNEVKKKDQNTPAKLDFGAALDAASKNTAVSTLTGVQGVNPDTAAQNRQLAKDTGMPFSAISGNEALVKQQASITDAANALSGAPATSSFLSDTTNASVASDSVRELTNVEKAAIEVAKALGAGGGPSLGQQGQSASALFLAEVPVTLSRMVEGAGQFIGIAERAAARPVYAALEGVGLKDLANALRDTRTPWYLDLGEIVRRPGMAARKDIQSAMQTLVPPSERTLVTQAAQGLGQVAVQAAIFTWTGSFAGLASSLTLLAQGITQQTSDMQQTGGVKQGTAKTDTALLIGGVTAALTERYSLDKFFNKIPGAKSLFKRVISGATNEATQEFVQQVAQNVTALALYDTNRDIYKGAAQTLAPSGAVGAIVSAIIPGRYAQAIKHGMDKLHENVQASPLTGRDVSLAEQHVEQSLTTAGVAEVYVPVDTLITSPAALDVVSESKVTKATMLGGDVKLSMGELAKIVVDTKAYGALSAHLRFGADGVTSAEAGDPAFMKEEVSKALALSDLSQGTKSGNAKSDSSVELPLAKELMGFKALFGTAGEAGMTPSIYKSYMQAQVDAAEQGKAQQKRKQLKAEKKRLSTDWQAKWAHEKQTVEESLRQEPVYAAIDAVGANRLDRNAIIDLLPDGQGQALLKQLPKQDGGRRIYGTKAEGGMHPQVLAQRFGFDSADTMLFDMANVKPFKEVVLKRTEQAMAAKHPELTGNVRSINEAIASLANDAQSEVLGYELAALRQAEGRGAISVRALRAEVKRQIGEYTLSNINPGRFLAAAKRKAAETGKLVRAGDIPGASKAKFQQLANLQMYQEALATRTKVEKQLKDITKYVSKRKKWDAIDAGYVDLIKAQLATVNLGPASKASGANAVAAEMAKKMSEDGAVFTSPASDLTPATDPKSMTLKEWNTFYKLVKTTEAQGRLKKNIYKEQKQRDFAELRNELVVRADALPDTARAKRQRSRDPYNPGPRDRLLRTLASLDADVKKVEFLLQTLDGGESIALWHQSIFQPIADAQTVQLDLEHKSFSPLLDKLGMMEKKVLQKMGRKVHIPGMGTFEHSDLLMMALNTGSVSNYNKMLEGSKPRKGDPNAPPAWTEKGVEEALTNLTPDEARWVQEVWDTFGRLHPQVEAIYRRESGVSPTKIEPREVTIAGVKLKGGYMPMLYDPLRRTPPRKGADKAQKGSTDNALKAMEDFSVQQSVFSGMTQDRIEYASPVSLDITRLPTVLQQFAHYVSHYDTVRDVKKIINDPQITAAVSNKLGPEYHAELQDWINAVATEGMSNAKLNGFDKIAQALRANVTHAIMGFSYTTMVSQTFGLTSSIAVLGRNADGSFSSAQGADWMAVGMEKYMRDPFGMAEMVMKVDGEMRYRIENTDRDMAYTLRRISRRNGTIKGNLRSWWDSWNKASLITIGGAQFYTVDVPTWLGAYSKGLHEGMDPDKAVKYAGHVVRTSQATGHVKDLSHLQRQKGIWRALTMFSSYTMVLYNLEAQTFSDVKVIKDLPNAIARMAWLIALPAIADALMRQQWPKDDKPGTVAKSFGLKAIGYAATAVPIAGRAVDSMLAGYDPALSAVESLGKNGRKFFNDFGDIVTGNKNVDVGVVKSFVLFTGGLTGAGGSAQIARGLGAMEADAKGKDVKPYDFLTGYRDK